VEKAREVIMQIHREVQSNPRLAIVQLFGSASGYVVSHAALGSNVCDLALIPEMKFTMKDVCHYIGRRLKERRNDDAPCGVIVVAETAIPTDYSEYVRESYVGLDEKERHALEEFHKNNRRVIGQTPDALRSGGFKIICRVLQEFIKQELGAGKPMRPPMDQHLDPDPYWTGYRVLASEPRHIVRSVAPSVTDVALGIRLGTMAVDMAMAGYTDCMVSQWLTEYVVVPLKLVVLGRKTVPLSGIFWKTVVAKTRQIEVPGLTGADSDESDG
jgi:6-phosphofructokinase